MLEFRDITVRYGAKPILEHVSFSLRPHRLTVLLGRNGSGKSTLLSCVNQRTPYTGEIREGESNLAFLSPRERARLVAILHQSIPAPHITAEELVAFGRSPYLDLSGRLTVQDRELIDRAMHEADADSLRERYVDTLSGGEQQRVFLAMALAQNTRIVLLDEPTAHMDPAHEAALLRRVSALKRKHKKTFLVVLHDLSLAVAFADDLVVLDDHRIVFAGEKERCLQEEILERTFFVRRYTFEEDGVTRIFFAPQ